MLQLNITLQTMLFYNLSGKFINIKEEQNLLRNIMGLYTTQSICTDIKHHTIIYYIIGKISWYKIEKK